MSLVIVIRKLVLIFSCLVLILFIRRGRISFLSILALIGYLSSSLRFTKDINWGTC